MQDLIIGETYLGTLTYGPWAGEKVVVKYVGEDIEIDGTYQFSVVEYKDWPFDPEVFNEGPWGVGQTVNLSKDAYEYELYNIVLENE